MYDFQTELAKYTGALERRVSRLEGIEKGTATGGGGSASFDDAEGNPANVAATAIDGVSTFAARRDHRHALAGTLVHSLGTVYFPGTAEVTAGTILAKLLTVDGAGSLLDADKLDGAQLSDIMGTVALGGLDIPALTSGTPITGDLFPYYGTAAAANRKTTFLNMLKYQPIESLTGSDVSLWTGHVPFTYTGAGFSNRTTLGTAFEQCVSNMTTFMTDYGLDGSYKFPIEVGGGVGGYADVSDILTYIKANDGSGSTFDADTVDGAHYETGTFSPGLRFGGGNTGMTFSTAPNGSYTKIGRLVFFTLSFTLSATGSSSGQATIIDLPFTSIATYANPVTLRTSVMTLTGDVIPQGFVGASGTTVFLEVVDAGTRASMTDAHFNATTALIISGCYQS
jgi:hypothetical protein